jgi:hypothetical protein
MYVKDTKIKTDLLQQLEAKLKANLQKSALSQITETIARIYLASLNEV